LTLASNAPDLSLRKLETAVGEETATIVLPKNLNLKADPFCMLFDHYFNILRLSQRKIVPVFLEKGKWMGKIVKSTSNPWNPTGNHRGLHQAVN